LPTAFVRRLLQIALSKRIGVIVSYLLDRELVSDHMVDGGVFLALYQAGDWVRVPMSFFRVILD
jgi:hypothetical protein